MSPNHPSPTRQATRTAAVSLAAAAVLLGSAPGNAATPVSVGSSNADEQTRSGTTPDKARGPWQDLGELSGQRNYGWPVIAGSPTGRWVSSAQRQSPRWPLARNVMVRGDKHGVTDKVTYKVGMPSAAWVGPNGDAIVIGQKRGGAILAVSWRHDRKQPTTRVLADADLGMGMSGMTLLSNSAGDLTAHSTFGNGKRYIVRKPAGRPWGKPVTVVPHRYDAELADLAMDGKGRLYGAFFVDHTVSLRTLTPSSRQFGAAREIISWPEIEDWPQAYVEYPTVSVSEGGNKVVGLAFGNWNADGPRYGRAVIMPRGAPRWEGEWEDGSLDEAVVGSDGRVTVPMGTEMMQWTPQRPSFRTRDDAWFKTANPRGDLLVGDSAYRGHLFVWPDGRAPLPPVRTPGGYTRATALAGAVAYAAVARNNGTYHMFRARLGR